MKVRENTQRDMGYRIAQRRTEMGLSQEKLAESIGVNRNTVMRIENGEHAPRADIGKCAGKVRRDIINTTQRLLSDGWQPIQTGGMRRLPCRQNLCQHNRRFQAGMGAQPEQRG